MNRCFMILSSFLLVVAIGCGSDETNTGNVAILDLDLVAKRLGRDLEMADSIQQRENVLNQQLAVVQTSFLNTLNEKQTEFGDEPEDDETQELLGMRRNANLKLNAVRQKAQGNLARYRNSVVSQFREEAKPIARQIAAEKGLQIVLTKNEVVVFSYDSVVDITEEVIARMSALTKSNKGANPATPKQTAPKSTPQSSSAKPTTGSKQ